MRRKIADIFLSLCLILAGATPGLAGGALETIDMTGSTPSPFPGLITVRVIGMKWDSRSIPVKYSMNNTLDPIPNPLGDPVLSLADAQAVFQKSLNAWNDIPTSFIDMRITGTTDNSEERTRNTRGESKRAKKAGNFACFASCLCLEQIWFGG